MEVLAALQHPNVVRYYECFAEHGKRLHIVMELCEVRLVELSWLSDRWALVHKFRPIQISSQEGDLDQYLKRQSHALLDEDEIMLKFVQICLGLLHVHSKVSRLGMQPFLVSLCKGSGMLKACAAALYSCVEVLCHSQFMCPVDV